MELTKEELLAELARYDEADAEPEKAVEVHAKRAVEVRGRTVAVDDRMLTSWPVVRRMAAFSSMEGIEAVVALMQVVTDVTDLEEEDVLEMAGGHYADVEDVARALRDISEAAFPKK
jgi:hypothetical protein